MKRVLLLSSLLSGLVGCIVESAPECTDDGACSETQACLDNVCTEVACKSSTQCSIGTWCNPDSYSCEVGCALDTDCLAGQSCDPASHQCQDEGCRSTTLDCAVGEFCDVVNGVCFDDPQPLCQNCNVYNPYSCGSNAYCLSYDDENVGWCFNYCSTDADCPNGFSCFELGWPYENVCVADCPLLTSRGYL